MFFLKSDEIKMLWTFCSSLTLISFKLWAEPMMAKLEKVEYAKWENLLLKEGM